MFDVRRAFRTGFHPMVRRNFGELRSLARDWRGAAHALAEAAAVGQIGERGDHARDCVEDGFRGSFERRYGVEQAFGVGVERV